MKATNLHARIARLEAKRPEKARTVHRYIQGINETASEARQRYERESQTTIGADDLVIIREIVSPRRVT